METKYAKRLGLCLLVLLLCASFVSAAFTADVILKVGNVVCGFYDVFKSIATGVAAVVMVIAGVKWVASENDPGARKAAKDTMVHAIVGLIIVTIVSDVIRLVGLGTMCS
ncbi:MAG: TrbC/VirB2 family protein [Candidatus Altiarchaeota archaeon]|nr:TrbC/VirB2 family protein [Candidatus Altiarchaeota archaeon]